MKRIILGFLTLALTAPVAGCNTIKGIGEDVKTVGGWISSGSEHVEESIKKNPPGSGK